MKRFLLPCDCNERVVVTVGQAGDHVRCPGCGGRLAVPRLGGIVALEPAPEESIPDSRWTVGQGWGLAGLLVAGAAVAAAIILRSWAVGPPSVSEAAIRAAVAASDIGVVHRAWGDMSRSGVHRPPLPEEMRRQRLHRSAEAFSWLLWGVAFTAAAVAAVAFALNGGAGHGRRQRVVAGD